MSEVHSAMNLYRELLGERWNDVHPKVRASHLDGTVLNAKCCLNITGSSNVLGRLIGRMLSFPGPKTAAPVDLHITTASAGECWERKFPDRNLRSLQFISSDGYLVDQFGMIAFGFRLTLDHGSILHNHERTFLLLGKFKLPLPNFVSPKIMSHEEPDLNEEASRISVSVHVPGIGNILTYSGTVCPLKETS